MHDDDLKAIWSRAGRGTPLSRTEIEDLLRPGERRTGRGLAYLVWTYVAMLAGTFVLALVGLPGYRDNSTMLAVQGLIALASGVFLALTLRLYAGLRRVGRLDRPLLETVEQRLDFVERAYQPWLVMASITPWLLSLAINTLIDNDHGNWRINRPLEFVAMTAVMLGITYVSLRVATIAAVRELRAMACDLRDETLEATAALAPTRRRLRIQLAIGALLLVAAVVAGLVLWFANA